MLLIIAVDSIAVYISYMYRYCYSDSVTKFFPAQLGKEVVHHERYEREDHHTPFKYIYKILYNYIHTENWGKC